MNRLLAQSLQLGQAQQVERGNEFISQGKAHDEFRKAAGLYQQKKQRYAAATATIKQKIGEQALQSAEMLTPPIWKGAKAIGKKYGIDDVLQQKQEGLNKWTESVRGRVSSYLDQQTPDFIRKFTQAKSKVDERYKPTGTEAKPIEMEDVGEHIDPTTDKYINDATYSSIQNKVQNLSPEGQDWYRKKAENINEGLEHPIDKDTGEIDPAKLPAHADALVDAGDMFGYKGGLPGGGRFSDQFKEWWRAKRGLEDPRYGAADSPKAPQETIAKLYESVGARPVMGVGETTSVAGKRMADARYKPSPSAQKAMYQPEETPPEGTYKPPVGMDWDDPAPQWKGGGVGLEATAQPAVSSKQVQARMAAQQTQREGEALPEIKTLQPKELAPYQKSLSELRGSPARPLSGLRPTSDAPGMRVLADVMDKKRIEPAKPTISGMGTQEPSVAKAEAPVAAPVAEQQPTQMGGSGILEQARANIQERTAQPQPQPKKSDVVEPKEGEPETIEGGKGIMGGYGLEAGFGLAAVGELADPLTSARKKATQVGETAGLYAGAKIGEKALESTGAKAGLAEVMTGVEAVQDLTDKNLSASQKVGKVSAAVGTYSGAMAAESLVPGLGELAMVGTALGELGHGLHKEHKEKMEEAAREKADPLGQAPTQQQFQPHTTNAIAFDSAPVIDSSNYHSI